jgi:hypothetical protein
MTKFNTQSLIKNIKKINERKHARTRLALGAAVKENVREQNCHSNTTPLPTSYTFCATF